jgi:hypothetical protein
MEPKCSLPNIFTTARVQPKATYLRSFKYYHLIHTFIFESDSLFPDFQIHVYVFLTFPICATYLAHLMLFDSITVTTFGENYKS